MVLHEDSEDSDTQRSRLAAKSLPSSTSARDVNKEVLDKDLEDADTQIGSRLAAKPVVSATSAAPSIVPQLLVSLRHSTPVKEKETITSPGYDFNATIESSRIEVGKSFYYLTARSVST